MPRLLDLFCGQGGAADGYAQAGWEVVGVDAKPQPLYPFEFVQADALEYVREHGADFDAIHASPPCQKFTAYRRRAPELVGAKAPDLIAATREALQATGRPFVIENVPGAPLRSPVVLCGSMFGLDVRRHRCFELGGWRMPALTCDHKRHRGSFPPATNRPNRRKTCEVGVWRIPLETQKRAMGGCHWMDLKGLSQAVPPAYTRALGLCLRQDTEDTRTPVSDDK